TPNGALCNTTFTPVVTLSNYGATTLTSVQIQYYVDGNSPTTYNWSGSLGSNSSTQVTLNALTTTAGAHTFTARTNQNSLNGSNSDQETGNDQSTSNFNVGSGGTEVNITVELDCWGDETTWELRNAGGTLVASGGPYVQGLPDGAGTETASACLDEGCYDFTINDSEGDGIYGSQWGSCNVNGNYTITDGNGAILAQMIANQGDFGTSETQNFCLGAPTTTTCGELFNFNGATYTVNEMDEPSFVASFYDEDEEDVNTGLAQQGFISNWMLLDEEVAPGDTNDFVLITSYHADETAAADNWLTFGPITMPSDGGEISWKHRYVDNGFRDAYEVLVGTVGVDPGDFGAATTLYSVTNNDGSTDGDLTWTDQSVDLPAGTYAGQELYFAFHHNALNMYFLLLDDIVVEGCSTEPVGITENESIDLAIYPNPSSENFVVRYSNKAGDDLTFSMFNTVGQEVWSKTSSSRGTAFETINTSNLTSGVYTLVVRGSNLNESKRLILAK
ncbi:MAG: choice-of-anchor J domain-containing protein, partial [Flavobacteriales bacterium]